MRFKRITLFRPDVWSFLLGLIYFPTLIVRLSTRMKKNSKQYNSTNIYLKNTRVTNLMALRTDWSTKVHLEFEWFQIVLSVCLSLIQVMKFCKGVKVGANSRPSAECPTRLPKVDNYIFQLMTRPSVNLWEKKTCRSVGSVLDSLMVKAQASGIVVSEFEILSCCYVHFRINTLGKGMNPLILPAMG